jgi:cytoskeletal protein RodZ
MLIALAATVVLAVVWMGVLRPRAVESTTAEVTAPAKVATQAAAAAAATDATNAATEAAADAVADPSASSSSSASTPAAQAAPTATTPTPAAKAAPKQEKASKADAAKPAAKDPQAAILADLDAKKVVVLLIWDKAGADDRAARDSVRDLDRRDGKVAVHVASVQDVGELDAITQGVDVTQTPTTIIVAPDGTARTVVGLTDPTEVAQLVREALQAK